MQTQSELTSLTGPSLTGWSVLYGSSVCASLIANATLSDIWLIPDLSHRLLTWSLSGFATDLLYFSLCSVATFSTSRLNLDEVTLKASQHEVKETDR